jgi:hypothetical protein
MKIVSILLLVLMLNVSCREMKTTAVESNSVSNKNQKQQPEESARINLKLNGRNTSGLFDFVFSKENKIIGIGIGSQSGVASANKKDGFESKSKEIFFVCSSDDWGKTWHGERGIPYENIGTISGITESDETAFIAGADGSIWTKNETKWQSIYEPKSDSYSFRHIEFASNGIGFAVSETEYGSQIFKTQNSGKLGKKFMKMKFLDIPSIC